jgi:hypothetical protein
MQLLNMCPFLRPEFRIVLLLGEGPYFLKGRKYNIENAREIPNCLERHRPLPNPNPNDECLKGAPGHEVANLQGGKPLNDKLDR